MSKTQGHLRCPLLSDSLAALSHLRALLFITSFYTDPPQVRKCERGHETGRIKTLFLFPAGSRNAGKIAEEAAQLARRSGIQERSQRAESMNSWRHAERGSNTLQDPPS